MASEIKYEVGSGNVYADLGWPDADQMFVKAQIVLQIRGIIEQRGLCGAQLEEVVQMSEPELRKILRGRFSNVTEGQLFSILNRLGRVVEIRIAPEETEDAHTSLAVA